MIICVDFDGTLVDHRFPHIGPSVPDAVKWLKRLHRCGADLILFTMRSDSSVFPTALADARKYLFEQGLEYMQVNENPAQLSWTTSPKIYGDVYVDDSAFGCPLIQPKGFQRPCVDWSKVGPELENRCLSMC